MAKTLPPAVAYGAWGRTAAFDSGPFRHGPHWKASSDGRRSVLSDSWHRTHRQAVTACRSELFLGGYEGPDSFEGEFRSKYLRQKRVNLLQFVKETAGVPKPDGEVAVACFKARIFTEASPGH